MPNSLPRKLQLGTRSLTRLVAIGGHTGLPELAQRKAVPRETFVNTAHCIYERRKRSTAMSGLGMHP